MSSPSSPPEPVFDKPRHIRYWLRCFKTLLPTHYTSTDSNRMFLAFCILSSLDILGVLHSSQITPTERSDAVDWIYHCQHVNGGFRAFTGTIYAHASTASKRDVPDGSFDCLDQANLAGTSFALASLVVLRDDLSRVKRDACLKWLKRLQAPDGSFAQVLGRDGKPDGSRDVRHSYFAVATRCVLDALGEVRPEEDFDCGALLGSVYGAQGYDGGVGGEKGWESHGGYAYCAVGCLRLLGQLKDSDSKPDGKTGVDDRANEFIQRLIPELVSKQIGFEPEESDDEDDEGPKPAEPANNAGEPEADDPEDFEPPRWVGFDGRCNKPADTCYTFWVGGALAILGLSDTLIDPIPHRRFLLEMTEHRIGGFGKTPGDPPDILHSFMGILALSLMHERGLEPVDASMAITRAARAHLESIRSRRPLSTNTTR